MKTRSKRFLLVLSILTVFAATAKAQTPPSEAQIRRDVMNPGVIEIIMRGSGSFERFVENGAAVDEYYRSITVRRKTDKPGVTVDVLGDVVYRLIGGRWIYRTMRLAENRYSGISNPTVAQINKVLGKARISDFIHTAGGVIGEFESLRMSSDPKWEWFTPNSVAFNVIAVFREVYRGGSYQGESSPQFTPGITKVDRVEATLRIRIYRESEKQPWARMMTTRFGKGTKIQNSKGEMVYPEKMLQRKEYPNAEVRGMPHPTKLPLIEK